MKNPKLRSHLLVGLMFVVSFAAAWLSVSLVQTGRAAQDGIIADDVPREPPASEFRGGPYSAFYNPQLAGPNDPVEVMVELEDPPAIEAFLQAQERGASFARAAAPQAITVAQARLARIEQAQQKLARLLTGPPFNARITSRVQRIYNGIALHVASGKLAALHALPGVKAVHLPELIYPATDTSVPFINAHQVWGTPNGQGFRGEGITIAVIDSGIDYLHATLGGSGSAAVFNDNDPTIVGDVPDFPNVKVIGGVDLVGDSYNAADPNNNTPNPDSDPVDCKSNGHGTATAGIAASIGLNADGTVYTGDYNQSTNFSAFRLGPGVAPKANLYAIRVFGCNAFGATSNTVMTQALERALDPNQDGNFSDRARVVLIPGGGPFSTLPDSPVIAAINNGAQMKVLYVGAAGNGGDTFYSVGGPALAEGALAVVNTADNGLFLQNIRVTNPFNGTFQGAVSEFGLALSTEIAENLIYAVPNDGCAPLTNAAQMNGKIAFLERGTCTLTTKARNAQAAGAVAVIIANNTPTLPIGVGDDGTGSDVTIPSFLLAMNGADAIRQELNGSQVVNVSLTPSDVTPISGLANSYASSNPYGGVYPGNILKPDITAPGTNISGPVVGSGNLFHYISGTSFSAPHVAGTAALLLQKYPAATTQQIYAKLRSTGENIFLGANAGLPEMGPGAVGGGGVDAQAAANTDAAVTYTQVISATHLYGDVIEATESQTLQRELTFDWNSSARTATYNVNLNNLANLPGLSITVPNPTGTAGPNSTAEIPYQYLINPSALKRNCAPWVSPLQASNPRHCPTEAQGYLTINLDGGHPPVRTPYYAFIRPASQMGTEQTALNLTGQPSTITLNLTGQGVNNGPAAPTDWRSLVAPFELQVIDPNESLTPPELDYFDIQYVGARSNRRAVSNSADTRLTFGISTYGPWVSPNQLRFNAFLDTNRDGQDDIQLFSTSFPNAQGAPSDVFVTRVLNLTTGVFSSQAFFVNSFSPAQIDTNLYHTDVVSLTASAASLGLTEANNPIDVQFKTSFGNVIVDESPRFTFDWVNPALDFGAGTAFNDLPGGTIPITYNSNSLGQALEGLLNLHYHNTRGARAQILPANLGQEGDVNSDGQLSNLDFTQALNIAAALEEVNLGNEFQRTDTATRSSKGDGNLKLTDAVQTGRYVANLDPATSAGGPLTPASDMSQFSPAQSAASLESDTHQTRTLRALNTNFLAGQSNSLDIELEALGGENAVSFTLNYDPGALNFVSADLGSAASGATLVANDSQAASGSLGLVLALPPGQGLQAGARKIASVRFNIAPGSAAATTPVSFGDQIVARQLVNANAEELMTNYSAAQVTLVRAVVNVLAASFTRTALASEAIIAAFGQNLATSTQLADTLPLPTQLAGTTVKVRDSAGTERLAELFFVSPGQINYWMPPGTVPGAATITVTSSAGFVSLEALQIAHVSPGLFAANANGQGVAAAVALRVKADGTQSFEPIAQFDATQNRFVSLPLDLGPATDQVFLILFGTGLRFRSALNAVSAQLGGVETAVLFVGAQGDLVGLDQINLGPLPRTLAGRGEVDIGLLVDGKEANPLRINIK